MKLEAKRSRTFTFFINKSKPWQRSTKKPEHWDKVRTITCYSKETNYILTKINRVLSYLAEKDLDDDQFGFRTERGTLDMAKIEQSKVICIDLKDAFHNIKRKRIRRVLRKYLTAYQADKLARNMTPNGYMFQGHPIAPLMLNLCLVECLKDIRNVFGNTLVGFHYADDLNFFVKENFNKRTLYSMASKIVDMLKAQGFKVNKRKINVYSSGKCWKTLGLKKEYRIGFKRGYWKMVPPRYLKRKVRMFVHWLEKGRYYTKRKSKLGKPINTGEVLFGILNYLKAVREADLKPLTFRKHTGKLEAWVLRYITEAEQSIQYLNEADMNFFKFI